MEALDASGMLVGTAIYMSPEQILGQPVGPTTDLYSLGCIIYECLFGRPPYESDTSAALLFQHVQEPIPLPNTTKGAPPELLKLLHLSLAKKESHRFSSMKEMEEAIDVLLSSTNSHTDALMPFSHDTTKSSSRSHLVLASIATALFVASIILALSNQFLPRQKPAVAVVVARHHSLPAEPISSWKATKRNVTFDRFDDDNSVQRKLVHLQSWLHKYGPLHPSYSPWARLSVAQLQQMQGRVSAAEQSLLLAGQEARRTPPDNASSFYESLAIRYGHLGLHKTATEHKYDKQIEQYLGASIEASADAPVVKVRHQVRLAAFLNRAGKIAEGERLLQTLVANASART